MLTKDCPAAQEFLGCHIRSWPDDFLFLTQGQYFFIFQKDAAFAGHLICFCPVMQCQFSTLSKTYKRIFKKSQLILHHQNPECAFVDKGFRNLSVLHQFFQSEHISRTHHIYIHSGFYSLNRRFIHIGCHTLFFQLSDGTPVWNHCKIKSFFIPQKFSEKFLIPTDRFSVYGIKSGHNHSWFCLQRHAERFYILFQECPLGYFNIVIFPACIHCSVTCKMFQTCCDSFIVFLLIAIYHGFPHDSIHIWVFTKRLQHPAPPGIPWNIDHRRKGCLKSFRRCLRGSYQCCLWHQFRMKGTCLPQWNRENRPASMDHICHKE